MDSETLALMIPVLALSIPVLGILCYGLVRMTRHWADGMSWLGGGSSDELIADVAELQRELTALGQDLAETQERLDFAERLLTRPDVIQALPDQSHPPAS
jgi:hypothetical protein